MNIFSRGFFFLVNNWPSIYFLLITLIITSQACLDPSTTVHIQNYEGSIYLSPNPNSGYGCSGCDDQEIYYINIIGKNNNDPLTTDVYITSESSKGATATSSSESWASAASGMTTTSGVTSSSGSGFAPTSKSTPTTENDCGCVSKHLSSCVPINCVTLCSGSYYGYPGYNNGETSHNYPGTGSYGSETCYGYDNSRRTGYNYPATSSNGAVYYYNNADTSKYNNPEATRCNKQGSGCNIPDTTRYNNRGTGCNNCETEYKNGGATQSLNAPYYQNSINAGKNSSVMAYGILHKNYCDCECNYGPYTSVY